MLNTNSFNETKINSIHYNADRSCMALATNKGYKIFTLDPFVLKRDRDFGAPIQIA